MLAHAFWIYLISEEAPGLPETVVCGCFPCIVQAEKEIRERAYHDRSPEWWLEEFPSGGGGGEGLAAIPTRPKHQDTQWKVGPGWGHCSDAGPTTGGGTPGGCHCLLQEQLEIMHAKFAEAIDKAWEHADKLTVDSGIVGTLRDGTRVNQEAQSTHPPLPTTTFQPPVHHRMLWAHGGVPRQAWSPCMRRSSKSGSGC